MKKVIYNGGKMFLLTNLEFSKAIQAFNQKNGFYCVRLQSLLSPYYQYVETDEIEIDKEVYLLVKEGGIVKKIYKQDEKYFVAEGLNGNVKLYPFNMTKEIQEDLINQEDFYTKKLYLK